MDEGFRAGLTPITVDIKRLRNFGLGLGGLFLLFGLTGWRKGSPHARWWLIASPWPCALALARPWWLERLYRPWMRVASAIAFVNTILLLGALYFLLITPYAAVMRLLGRDWLDERLGTAESYWRLKAPSQGQEAHERQF